MSANKVDRKSIEAIAAIRAGIALPVVARKLGIEEKELTLIRAEFATVPDKIVFGMDRLFDHNLKLKNLIADLTAKVRD